MVTWWRLTKVKMDCRSSFYSGKLYQMLHQECCSMFPFLFMKHWKDWVNYFVSNFSVHTVSSRTLFRNCFPQCYFCWKMSQSRKRPGQGHILENMSLFIYFRHLGCSHSNSLVSSGDKLIRLKPQFTGLSWTSEQVVLGWFALLLTLSQDDVE